MERIAILIGRCTIYEQLYLKGGDIPDIAKKAAENLSVALLALYTAILQALSRLVRIFKGKDPAQPVLQFGGWAANESPGKTNILKPPEATLAELEAIEQPESVVESAASVVGKCCKHPDL